MTSQSCHSQWNLWCECYRISYHSWYISYHIIFNMPLLYISCLGLLRPIQGFLGWDIGWYTQSNLIYITFNLRVPNLVIIVSADDLASNSTEFLWLSMVSLYVCWPDDITQMFEEMLRHSKWQTVLLWVLSNCLCNTRISLTYGKITKIKCVFTKPSSFFGIFK